VVVEIWSFSSEHPLQKLKPAKAGLNVRLRRYETSKLCSKNLLGYGMTLKLPPHQHSERKKTNKKTMSATI
jgi:hypothetical protein